MPVKPNTRSPCPVVFALDLFGDRWSLLIVRDLVFSDRSTYGEFLEAAEGISTNILADRLRHLEEQGIITRHPDPEHRSRFFYRLTEKGCELIPTLVEMMRWSVKYQGKTPFPADLKRKILKTPKTVIKELTRRARTRARDV